MTAMLWNLGSFIVALGILVFIHEYGHYWVAKRNGVKVLRFSVGFGKKLYSWTNKSGTEFVIGAIPLGGYVRMLDGRVDDVSEADRPFSFDQKRVGQRIAIVAAGPLANFLFAAVALLLMFIIGVTAVRPVVGSVDANSIASRGGMMANDIIVSVGDTEVVDWQETSYAMIKNVGGINLPVSVQRDGFEVELDFDIAEWQLKDGGVLSGLGIVPLGPKPTTQLAYIEEGSAADLAGLQVSDTILAMNNEAIESWQQLVEIISNSADQEIVTLIARGDQRLTVSVVPANRPTEEGFSNGYLGVIPKVEKLSKDYVFTHQYAILPALQKAVVETWDRTVLSFQMFGKLLTGKLGLDNLSGPISIAQGAGTSASYGLEYFLGFLAWISINLGVVNLLPLPILDGGHLMYFFIELIRGKPVSERVQEIGFRVGAFVLLMIMGIALMNDFGRL